MHHGQTLTCYTSRGEGSKLHRRCWHRGVKKVSRITKNSRTKDGDGHKGGVRVYSIPAYCTEGPGKSNAGNNRECVCLRSIQEFIFKTRRGRQRKQSFPGLLGANGKKLYPSKTFGGGTSWGKPNKRKMNIEGNIKTRRQKGEPPQPFPQTCGWVTREGKNAQQNINRGFYPSIRNHHYLL